MFQPLGFFVRARPVDANHLGQKHLGKAMAQDQVLCDRSALARQTDFAVAADTRVTSARHPLKCGCDGWRSNSEVFRETRAYRTLALLHGLPDRLQVIFLRDARCFPTHNPSRWLEPVYRPFFRPAAAARNLAANSSTRDSISSQMRR